MIRNKHRTVKYTQRKWGVGPYVGTGPIDIIEDDSKLIAVVSRSNYQEAEANAQLISAAPEMYEALKVVYDLLKMQYSIVLGHYPNYGKYPEIEQVEKALAKAEGR